MRDREASVFLSRAASDAGPGGRPMIDKKRDGIRRQRKSAAHWVCQDFGNRMWWNGYIAQAS